MKLKKQLAGALAAGVLVLGGPTAAMAYEAPVVPVVHQNNQGGQANFGNLVSALNNVNVQIDRLTALNNLTVSDIQVVNVEDVLNNSANQNRILTNLLNRNETNITVLQDFLNNSVNNNNVEILKGFLNDNNVVINDVVAIDVLSSGDIIVFTR